MKFTKMHGCGNDYVYVNLFEEKIADPAKVSIAVSDRHFGIGSDGLIRIASQAAFNASHFTHLPILAAFCSPRPMPTWNPE